MSGLSSRRERKLRFPYEGSARFATSDAECMAVLSAYLLTPDLNYGHGTDHLSVLTYVCIRRNELLHSLRGMAGFLKLQRARIKAMLADLVELELLAMKDTGKGLMLAPLIKPWMLQTQTGVQAEIDEMTPPDTGG